ncbi:SulP family inorganic anion transporter [Oceanihabitans sp. IOP_32]|uniref:SulP family inorganic anion transporter n=1 Tax=Oceanihabitans sp. IOP_32 TaxID=2529032 RepID=UPI001293C8D3|nr:SulP family inorganic anion transporter [Oceanihabitans sp. IOP_32]QFZ54200.1 SulP family inorganic anion transporter [Oceanihabitans sp. IOP_32]
MKSFFSNFRGDAFGGVTAGIVALPLALAFGVSSGLGPTAGLYGAIFVGFFAALFGGTNTQISGPTAPMTAVCMVLVSGIIAVNDGDVNKAIPIILSVFLLAGLIQVGFGVLGLGKYVKYIPYPVVSGFMTAIGVMILITQILPSLGYYPKEDLDYVNQFKAEAEGVIIKEILADEAKDGILVLKDFKEILGNTGEFSEEQILKESQILAAKETSGVWGAIKSFPRAFQNINWLELILALGTILIIYGFKLITKAIPSTLVALIVMSAIAIGFGLDYKPIEEIPSGFPVPNFEIFTSFSLSSISPYIFTAFTLALLGSIDSLLTSVVADNITKTQHKPNKELIGQGVGNSVAAIFGGLPGAGATIRTVVNINSGGKTRLSGMIAGVMLLIILLGLGPIASQIPAAVLAGVLITVGIGVMDYKGLRAITGLPKDVKLGPFKFSSEAAVMFAVLLLATFWNLVYAVAIGLVIESLMFMKKISDLTGEQSDVQPFKEKEWENEIDFPEQLREKVFVTHLKGPLFFGSITDFLNLTSQIPETASYVIMRMGRVRHMDQSGVYAMEDMLRDLQKKNIKVLFVKLASQPRFMMERIDIIPYVVTEDQIFSKFGDCVKWINKRVSP